MHVLLGSAHLVCFGFHVIHCCCLPCLYVQFLMLSASLFSAGPTDTSDLSYSQGQAPGAGFYPGTRVLRSAECSATPLHSGAVIAPPSACATQSAIAHLLAEMPGGYLASTFLVGGPQTPKDPGLGVFGPLRCCSCRRFGLSYTR